MSKHRYHKQSDGRSPVQEEKRIVSLVAEPFTWGWLVVKLAEGAAAWAAGKALESYFGRTVDSPAILKQLLEEMRVMLRGLLAESFVADRLSVASALLESTQRELGFYLLSPATRLAQLEVITHDIAYLTRAFLHVDSESTPKFWGYQGYVMSALVEMLVTQERIKVHGMAEQAVLGSQVQEFLDQLDRLDKEFCPWLDGRFSRAECSLDGVIGGTQFLMDGQPLGSCELLGDVVGLQSARLSEYTKVLVAFLNVSAIARRSAGALVDKTFRSGACLVLRHFSSGRELSARGGGRELGLSLVASMDPSTSDELFYLGCGAQGEVLRSGESISLRTRNGHYLWWRGPLAGNAGVVWCNNGFLDSSPLETGPRGWGRWIIQRVSGGGYVSSGDQITIQDSSEGVFLAVSGSFEVYCTSTLNDECVWVIH